MDFKHPKNETETHFMLKEISKYILFGWGYNMLGTEVNGMYSFDIGIDARTKGKDFKSIIDAVGIKRCHKPGKTIEGKYVQEIYYDMKGIEAKASLSDYKNGFCAAPAYTYIIAPIKTIPHDLIPAKIGFIEVNLDEFELSKYKNELHEMKGVNLVRKAKKRIDRRFEGEEAYRVWVHNQLDHVAYRASAELLFWRNYIKIH